MIITSRSGEFQYSLNNTFEYEIKSLNNYQIESFIKKWLNNKKMASDMIKQLAKSPYSDTAIRPLTLAHLCAIYERNLKIPNKPKTLYRKIVNLLLEDWDLQRNVFSRP